MTRLCLFSLLVVLAVPIYAKRQVVPCVEIYPELTVWGRGLYHKGVAVDPAQFSEYGLTGLKLKEGSKVTRLGSGSTAMVFRITLPSGAAYVFKRYVSTEHTPNTTELAQKYQRDLHYLEWFAKATGHEVSGHQATETIEVIKIGKVDQKNLTVKLADFKGFALIDVLDFMKGQDAVKYAALVAQYNQRVAVFVGDLRAAGMKVETAAKELNHPTLKTFQITLPNGTGPLDIAGHANTIYDPQTGRFMLVDPF